MKKSSVFMKGDSGFMLPYVLVVITIVLIVLTANVSIYEQEIKMTDHYLEQIEVEFLMQMAHDKFYEADLIESEKAIEKTYQFSAGSVVVTYSPDAEDNGTLYFVVHTNSGTRYTFYRRLTVNNALPQKANMKQGVQVGDN